MSGVTWGNNTVHTFGGTPSPSAFGAPAPAPAFGAPASTPATGGFGFGAPATNIAAKPSLFGTPAPAAGGFGSLTSVQNPQVPQHHIPAQAAMQVSIMLHQSSDSFFLFLIAARVFVISYSDPILIYHNL